MTNVTLNLDRGPGKVVLGACETGDTIKVFIIVFFGPLDRRATNGSPGKQNSNAVTLERITARENLLTGFGVVKLPS